MNMKIFLLITMLCDNAAVNQLMKILGGPHKVWLSISTGIG